MIKMIKKSFIIPSNVSISFSSRKILIEGINGRLAYFLPLYFSIKVYKECYFDLVNLNVSKKTKQLEPLIFTLIQNMLIGVSKKFEKILELRGIGYRAKIEKNKLFLSFSYSTSKTLDIPKNVEVIIDNNTQITINGIEKEKVHAFAALIRSQRVPEPYKGKGIFYKNEQIKLKKTKH